MAHACRLRGCEGGIVKPCLWIQCRAAARVLVTLPVCGMSGQARALVWAGPNALSGRLERVVGQARTRRRAGPNASLGRPEHAVGPARMDLQVSPLPVTESSARRAGRDATSRRVYERCRLGVLGRGENASLPQQNQRGPAKLPKTTVYAQRRHMSDADMPQKRRMT